MSPMGRLTTVCIFAALVAVALSTAELDLYNAVSSGNVTQVEAALTAGADVNYRNPNDTESSTPLHIASKNGSLSVVKVLVAWDADLTLTTNATNYEGFTALHIAARENHTAIAQVLLYAGINRYTLDAQGRNASSVATQYNFTELADIIDNFSNGRIELIIVFVCTFLVLAAYATFLVLRKKKKTCSTS